MKLTKAIEILAIRTIAGPTPDSPDYLNAIKLGIEALKAVKECRASHMFCPGLTMPGETIE